MDNPYKFNQTMVTRLEMIFLAILIASLVSTYLGSSAYRAYNAWKMGEVHKNPYDYGLLGGIALFQQEIKKERDYMSSLYKNQN
jgi:hypothetical protein